MILNTQHYSVQQFFINMSTSPCIKCSLLCNIVVFLKNSLDLIFFVLYNLYVVKYVMIIILIMLTLAWFIMQGTFIDFLLSILRSASCFPLWNFFNQMRYPAFMFVFIWIYLINNFCFHLHDIYTSFVQWYICIIVSHTSTYMLVAIS